MYTKTCLSVHTECQNGTHNHTYMYDFISNSPAMISTFYIKFKSRYVFLKKSRFKSVKLY